MSLRRGWGFLWRGVLQRFRSYRANGRADLLVRHRGGAAAPPYPTPTELGHSAQRWSEATTLGKRAKTKQL